MEVVCNCVSSILVLVILGLCKHMIHIYIYDIMCKQNDPFQHLQLTTFHNYGLVIGNRNWWSWRMEGTSVISDRGSVVTSRNVNVFTGPIRDQDLKIGTIFSCFIWLADRRLEPKRSQSNPPNELKNNSQWAKARHILNTTWIYMNQIKPTINS